MKSTIPIIFSAVILTLIYFSAYQFSDESVLKVYELPFRKIKYIASLGDSILAGYAALGAPFIENRGVSFISGDSENTVASQFKLYRDDFEGSSSGNHLVQICHGSICPGTWFKNDGLNAAQSGSIISNIDRQITHLIENIPTNNNEFKLITLFIGSNDLCASCDSNYETSPDNFENTIRSALARIKTEIPNTIVNMLLLFNVSRIHELINGDPYCRALMNTGGAFECQCAWKSTASRKIMDDTAAEYNKRIIMVSQEYVGLEDGFGVIVDPVLERVDLGTWSLDAVSKADCFHPSKVTHERMSKFVWNNLFRVFEEKTRFVHGDDEDYFTPQADATIKLN